MIHHNLFDYILSAVVMHLLAIGYYWRVKKCNLVLPMIHGKKSSEHINEQDEITNSKLLLAFIADIIAIGIVYWLVVI